MTALETDDLAVVTGPLTLEGFPSTPEDGTMVFLEPGEVVRIINTEDEVGEDGIVFVYGMSSELEQYIDATSLTPLSEIHEDTEIEWGAEDEQYVRLCGTHDYVYTEGE